jgi:hypothetical protein
MHGAVLDFFATPSAGRRLPQGTTTSVPSSRRMPWFRGFPLVVLMTTVPTSPWCGTAPDGAIRWL